MNYGSIHPKMCLKTDASHHFTRMKTQNRWVEK